MREIKAVQKVVLADCQCLARMGIRNLLGGIKNAVIADEVFTEKELIEKVKKHKPAMLVYDYDGGQDWSVETIEKLKSISPSTNIIIITSLMSKDHFQRAMNYGAISFLTKECDKAELTDALNATLKGEKFFCNKVLDLLLAKDERTIADNCEPTKLSTREIEIVKLIAQGKKNSEIATELFISIHTVATHRKNIFRKMEINSVSELVLYAIQQKWVA